MSRTINDDQFQFLISCIRHSNNGKIDYAEVAKGCSIVSRGAAVKRYYRLMKTHEINNSGDTTTSSTPTGSTNTTPKKKMNGKRKATDPETETESKRKASKKGKKDQAVESAEKVVKKADLGIIEDEDEDADMEGETLTRIKDESEDSG